MISASGLGHGHRMNWSYTQCYGFKGDGFKGLANYCNREMQEKQTHKKNIKNT